MLYASPNCITKYRLVRGNVQTPLYMRGPGECSGVFALDSAMDELAYKLKIDPLELRIRTMQPPIRRAGCRGPANLCSSATSKELKGLAGHGGPLNRVRCVTGVI